MIVKWPGWDDAELPEEWWNAAGMAVFSCCGADVRRSPIADDVVVLVFRER